MIVNIQHRCDDFNSYRAARVKSLFNAESGYAVDIQANLEIEGLDWSIGVIVGPSGSGKTSIGSRFFGEDKIINPADGWPKNQPIIDAIAPGGNFDQVTSALSAVGLGDVPSWLRPFHVLSNGEQFRASLARLIVERPKEVVVDEFTSVVDRQIAKIGAQAFAKSWRRAENPGKIVLLTPHYDVLDWLEPDWIYDTRTARFERGRLRRRPRFELEIRKVNSSYWQYFKPHYYLDLPMPVAAEYFVGTVDGELVCHVAVAPKFESKYFRATRLVVMPEWQGAGVGTRFLNWVGQYHLDGKGRKGKKYRMLFHTSHPQLCAYLRHSKLWLQKSAMLYGGNKVKSAQTIISASKRNGKMKISAGYGGHFRAVQGFAYIGDKVA